jgi:hypothetical protein
MDRRIQELVEFTKTKFGLNNYYLQRHQFYRSINIFNETVYTLSMEWFPNHTVQEDDGSNPEGTACIEINLNNHKFKSAIFVMGKSNAENGIMFANRNTEDIIKWIEDEMGLTYGRQFQIHKKEEGELLFKECIDGVAVYPAGYIEIKFDEEGRLTFFSVHGQFPSKELIREDKYSLSLDRLEHLKTEQLSFVEFPSHEQKKIVPAYAVEEIFVTNDGATTIPLEVFADENSFLKIDQTIYWDGPMNQPFERREIDWIEDLSAEQAFSCEPSPDSFPITKVEREKCMMAVKNLLRQEYPNESGNWKLKHIYRDKGYIHATLKANIQDYRVFQRKIKVFIEPKSFQAVNYMDSQLMLKTFDDFQAPDQVTITKEEAFEKLQELFELKPYYVYDFKQKQYVLCGKLDCQYGVNASNGEVIALDDL